MDMINSGDLVEYAAPNGSRRGLVMDVRCTAGSFGVRFTYIVGLEGISEPVTVTDRSKLAKVIQ